MVSTPPPNPEYPEYRELLEEAQRRAARFVDPSRIHYLEKLANRDPWASHVLGFYCHGLRYISGVHAELLGVADERGIDPPEPTWMREHRERIEQGRRDLEAGRAAIARRDAEAWETALAAAAAAGVELQVFRNPHARPRHGMLHQLGHAVPTADVYSGTGRVRVHRAGYGLCETERRPKPLQLEETESTGPATCVSCLKWAATVRSVR